MRVRVQVSRGCERCGGRALAAHLHVQRSHHGFEESRRTRLSRRGALRGDLFQLGHISAASRHTCGLGLGLSLLQGRLCLRRLLPELTDKAANVSLGELAIPARPPRLLDDLTPGLLAEAAWARRPHGLCVIL